MPHEVTTNFGQINENIRSRIKRYILLKLGAPVVKVELTESQLDECINVAFENFMQWTPTAERVVTFTPTPGQTKYDIPTILGTNNYVMIRKVVYSRVIANNVVGDFINNFLGAGLYPEWGFGFISTYGSNMTDFVIQSMYNEMFLRTIGLEGSWRIHGQDLYLSPTPTSNPGKAAVIYTVPPDDVDLHRIEWPREWALAEAKEILGRIYTKYGGLPGPRGQNIQLGGADLLKEAQEMKEKLLERRNEYEEPFGFLTG